MKYFLQTTDFHKTKYSVTLTIEKINDEVIISVLDLGPGIKDDVKGKIFTMFYRGNELSTGNGLGLYLVKSAIEKIDGKIEIETEEGKYSKFIIKFLTAPSVI